MSININYPNGDIEVVDINKFNPSDYSKWEIDDYVLEDGINIILRFAKITLRKGYEALLSAHGLDNDTKLFEFCGDDPDVLYARDLVLEGKDTLTLSDCDKLTSLVDIPKNIHTLNLIRCNMINSIEGYSPKLNFISLNNCDNLRCRDWSYEHIDNLKLAVCDIIQYHISKMNKLKIYEQRSFNNDEDHCIMLYFIKK